MDGLDADVLDMTLRGDPGVRRPPPARRPAAAARPRGRVPGRAGPQDVRRGPGHPAAVRPRGVRRDGRRQPSTSTGSARRWPRIDLGVATSVLATVPRQRPDRGGRAPRSRRSGWLTRIAEEGLLFAYGATEPEAGSDLGALKTTATPVERGRPRRRLPAQRAQAVDQQRRDRRRLHHPGQRPRRAELVRRRARRRRLHAGQARGQARHPAEQHRRAVPRRRARRPRRAGRRRRGPGPRCRPSRCSATRA